MTKGTARKTQFITLVTTLILTTSSLVQAGIFKMEREAYFVQYLHKGAQKTVAEVPLESITVGVRYLRRITEIEKRHSQEPFRGGLKFTKAIGHVQVMVLDTSFIEKGSSDERVFQAVDVFDDEMLHKRKPRIAFLGENRKLPVSWTEQSGRYIYMDFPPIPEDIKEGEILVKLKIKTPQGEQDFERRFPVYQKTYTGKYRIMD